METVVALVPPSNNSSNNSKNIKTVTNSSEVGGGGGHHTSGSTSCSSASSTTTDMTTSSATKPNPSSPSSSTPLNNSSNSNSNPIFVITNSSSSSSVATSSNNLEMPSNSCAEPVVTSSGVGSGAQCEDDEGGGDGTKGVSGSVGVNGGGSNGVTSTTTTTSTTSTTGQQRPSNPRQSTLTRSHAITLDEDSDGQQPSPSLISASGEPAAVGKVLPQEQEQDLIQFLIDTCNKSAKDKSFILRIEVDLTQFVKDESRHTLPFPQMTSYQRMLVHRMATLFDLDHNVDTSSGGNFVVVSKDLNLNGGRVGRGGRLPPIRFKEIQSHPSNNPAMIVSTSSSHIATSSIDQNTEAINNDPSSLNTLNSAPSAINPSSKKILKREKPNSGNGSGADKKSGPTKTKSLEERTQDYHKARRRIFEDSAGESGSGISLDNSVSASASSKKLNWSSTDSSEDRMYLKPPFPTSGSGGKLIKVESFESASQKKPSNRDSRAMGKSHSFGGYEDSQQQHPITNTGGGGGRPGKNFGGGAGNNNSNNASSSMISCSSSSSLRSSSFSKQDSSSSTTSGSGQSPSGGTSSGSTSGYKSSSSSGGCGGVVTGYYTGVGGANGGGMGHMGVMGQMGPVTMQPDAIKSPPSIIFAPAAGTVTPQQHHMAHQAAFYQTEDVSGTPVSSSQQVVFCCWAVTDLNNVPPGAMIIDPNTGQAIKNTDGTQYYYDPNNPPKFIQTLPVSQPPPPTTPQQEVSAYATAQPAMYPPAVLAGPPITAYQTASAQTPSNTQPATYMTVPTAGTAGIGSPIYFQPTASPGSEQDLSGYFSQLTVAGSGGGRSAPASVIYVPVDALGATATYASASDPQQQSAGYYDETQGAQSQQPQAVPVQFQSPPAAGYVLQSMVDPNGGTAGNASGGVYYYGGNLVQAPTAVQTVAAATATSTNGNSNQQHQQPRFKNWIVPHHASQHHPHQAYSLHGASSQVAPNAGAPPQQQCNQPSAAGSTIMIHSNAPPNSMVSAGPAGLVSVPAMLPPPHPGALAAAQQQQQAQQQSSQPSQQNSALVPLSYHPSPPQHQPPPPNGAASAQALMQTLVPCVQSPVYPAPPPPPPPPQPQHQQPQSFVPSHQQQHHQHHQQHSSHHHPPSHHSSRQQQHHHQQSHNHPHHHQSHNQPRFLTVASSTAAAAAAAAQQQQQAQQQHQLLFAAAAAAMAMSNNYSSFAGTTATSTSNTRFLKGTGRGSGGGAGVHHGPVTGVVRRGRNYGGGTNKQQQNSSK